MVGGETSLISFITEKEIRESLRKYFAQLRHYALVDFFCET